MTWTRFLLGSLCVPAVSAGCGTGTASDTAAMGGPGAPNVEDAGSSYGATSITFSASEIVFVPGTTRRLEVRVEPEGTYPVNLALVGAALDAYLDRSQVETAADGSATFSFTAPSSSTAFSIRASVGRTSGEVSASAGTGTTTLQIVPAYSGHRKIISWVGTVSAGGRCDPSAGVPPVDGDLHGEAADKPLVSNVPLGTSLTVTVRAGHFAGGCVEVPNVVANEAGAVGSVIVPATDRPLSMGGVQIPIKLGIDTTATWIDAWTALSVRMGTSFSPDSGSDGTALLDAMLDAAPTASQSAFAVARTAHAWDTILASQLHDLLSGHGLRSIVRGWITDALPLLATGALTGTLTSPDVANGTASLQVTGVGGVAPADAGFPALVRDLSWTAAPNDHVVFGGTVPPFAPFAPSALAAALSFVAARKDVPAANTVPAALAVSVGCPSLGKLVTYPGCDATCAAKGCEAALIAMWSRALAVDMDGSLLQLSASAAVTTLSDAAAPIDLDGTWVGDVQLGAGPIHVGGAALGGAHATAPR